MLLVLFGVIFSTENFKERTVRDSTISGVNNVWNVCWCVNPGSILILNSKFSSMRSPPRRVENWSLHISQIVIGKSRLRGLLQLSRGAETSCGATWNFASSRAPAAEQVCDVPRRATWCLVPRSWCVRCGRKLPVGPAPAPAPRAMASRTRDQGTLARPHRRNKVPAGKYHLWNALPRIA